MDISSQAPPTGCKYDGELAPSPPSPSRVTTGDHYTHIRPTESVCVDGPSRNIEQDLDQRTKDGAGNKAKASAATEGEESATMKAEEVADIKAKESANTKAKDDTDTILKDDKEGDKNQKEDDSSGPVELLYEGYVLQKAPAEPGLPSSWSRVLRQQLPFSHKKLESIVKARRRSSRSQTTNFTSLSSSQQGVINRLIQQKQHTEKHPRAEWVLANIKKEGTWKSWTRFEIIKIQVIIRRVDKAPPMPANEMEVAACKRSYRPEDLIDLSEPLVFREEKKVDKDTDTKDTVADKSVTTEDRQKHLEKGKGKGKERERDRSKGPAPDSRQPLPLLDSGQPLTVLISRHPLPFPDHRQALPLASQMPGEDPSAHSSSAHSPALPHRDGPVIHARTSRPVRPDTPPRCSLEVIERIAELEERLDELNRRLTLVNLGGEPTDSGHSSWSTRPAAASVTTPPPTPPFSEAGRSRESSHRRMSSRGRERRSYPRYYSSERGKSRDREVEIQPVGASRSVYEAEYPSERRYSIRSSAVFHRYEEQDDYPVACAGGWRDDGDSGYDDDTGRRRLEQVRPSDAHW